MPMSVNVLDAIQVAALPTKDVNISIREISPSDNEAELAVTQVGSDQCQTGPIDVRSQNPQPWRDLIGSLSAKAQVILPSDEAYDRLKKLWNARFNDSKPALIVRAAGVADVQAAVRFARQTGLRVTARAGGHSWAGLSTIDGGLVIDLRLMNQVTVDEASGVVTIGPGALLQDVDRATEPFGLAVPVGVVSDTGAGLILGGGIGWLCRQYGASVDSVLSADIVLADGTAVSTSADHEPDLFWAIRGAAPYLGLVTSVRVQGHPVDWCLSGTVFYKLTDAVEVLEAVNRIQQKAPRASNCEVYNCPRDSDSDPTVYLKVCYAIYLPHDDAEAWAKSLREIGNPVESVWKWVSHCENQSRFDTENPHHEFYYARNGTIRFNEITPSFLAAFAAAMIGTRPRCRVELIGIDGRIKDPELHNTAFGMRQGDWLVIVIAKWFHSDQSEDLMRWCDETFKTLGVRGRGYTNMNADEIHERLAVTTRQRLQDLKSQYDPTGMFRPLPPTK